VPHGATSRAFPRGNKRGRVIITHTEATKKSVLLVDDHPLMRLGMSQLISGQPDLMVCGQAEDANQALQCVADMEPNIVVLDLTLKDSDGLEVLKNINALYPTVPVLVLSIHAESLYAELALRAGAKGYVMKSDPLANVLTAIRRVLTGGIYVSDSMTSRLLNQHARGPTAVETLPLERLTDRERQVLRLLGHWHTTREIASLLHLSMKTVENYREKLKAKLNLDSASALVQFAVEWAQSAKRDQSTDSGTSPD
jgi:DNA-binding NarL/FixJ family response regulator